MSTSRAPARFISSRTICSTFRNAPQSQRQERVQTSRQFPDQSRPTAACGRRFSASAGVSFNVGIRVCGPRIRGRSVAGCRAVVELELRGIGFLEVRRQPALRACRPGPGWRAIGQRRRAEGEDQGVSLGTLRNRPHRSARSRCSSSNVQKVSASSRTAAATCHTSTAPGPVVSVYWLLNSSARRRLSRQSTSAWRNRPASRASWTCLKTWAGR
jgi:hypothetical protein